MNGSALHPVAGRNRTSGFVRYALVAVAGAAVAIVAVSLLTPQSSLALPDGALGTADGVFAVPAQLTSDVHGLYLIDTRNETILLYSYSPRSRNLRLLSARSFQYDRRLTNFNTDRPSPDQVRQLLETPTPTTPVKLKKDTMRAIDESIESPSK